MSKLIQKTMIMKKISQLVVIISALFLTSCVEKNYVANVKPEKVEISGDLSKYIEVVDNEYEITGKSGGDISIKLKSIQPLDDSIIENSNIKLTLTVLDEKGIPVSGTGDFNLDYSSIDKLNSLLKSGQGKEVIKFKAYLGDYKGKEHAEVSKKFTVSSSMTVKSQKVNNSVDSDDIEADDSDILSDGGENWDNMLNDYDDYVTNYVSLYKKAKAGDNSAMLEYPALMQKATDLQNSMAKAQKANLLSVKQVNRMNQIQMKMVQAMQ